MSESTKSSSIDQADSGDYRGHDGGRTSPLFSKPNDHRVTSLEKEQQNQQDRCHASFREEKLRIVNCLAAMDGAEGTTNNYRRTQSTRSQDEPLVRESIGIHATLKSRRTSSNVNGRGDLELPGAVQMKGPSAVGARSGGSSLGGGASLLPSRTASMKQNQLQAATQILQNRRVDVSSRSMGRYNDDEQLQIQDSSDYLSRGRSSRSSINVSAIEPENAEEGCVLSPQTHASTTVEDVTLRDPEPSPINPIASEGYNSRDIHEKHCLAFSRKTTLTIVVLVVLLVTTILVAILLLMKKDDGEYTTCSDLKKIPDIWNQCQTNSLGVGTIGGVPPCQEEMYAALSVSLALYLPVDRFAMDSCDATNMALLSMAETNPIVDSASVVASSHQLAERFALTCLYFAAQGNEWFNSSQWLSEGSHCTWHGIECNGSDFVIEIDLSSNNLRGTIPSELAILTEMRSIRIAEGALEGTIPSEIYQSLSDLEILVLQQNQFTEISSEIGSLESLIELRFELNELGRTALPSEVGLLSNLKVFDCGNCQLAGHIPTELGKCRELRQLQLDMNFVAGTLPSEIGHLTNLLLLDIFDNDLELERIPTELFDLTKLTTLGLASNVVFNGPVLPSSFLSKLSNLRHLNLSGLGLTGTIPSTDLIFLKDSMEILLLGGNRISGTIPTEIGMLTHLKIIQLQYNDLSGSLPSELGQLKELISVDLTSNPSLELNNMPPEVQALVEEKGACITLASGNCI